VARSREKEADAALEAAAEAVRAEGSDPGVTDTLIRQQLDLRKAAAEGSVGEAQQTINGASVAQKLVEAVTAADHELHGQQAKAQAAVEAASRAAATMEGADGDLRRCDLLERALDLLAAEKRVTETQAAVAKEADLSGRLEATARDRAALAARRSALTVPLPAAFGPMRRLATELAAARGALDVGFVVTVTPKARLDVWVRKDGQDEGSASTAKPLDIEARAEVEVDIGDIATVHVRGGRREAQEKATGLENRWRREVEPHLVAAGVADLAGLDGKSAEAHELDADIKTKDAELESLQAQIAGSSGAAQALHEASERASACRAALGDTGLDTFAAELKALGADAIAGLRKRRQEASKKADEARAIANQAANDRTLADERTRHSSLALDAAVAVRDAALAAFPEGVDAALIAARAAVAAGTGEKEQVSAELASLERTIDARKKRIDAALSGARANAAQATITAETAQAQLTTAKTNHAAEHGRFIELRKQRDAENVAAAETRLREATASHAALPIPDRVVTDDEASAARTGATGMKLELEGIERDIQRSQGALEQVGGAVARERLRDATEAFELAERQEREIEAEYEAWKLLLDQMKEADAAQASNLGQALGPAIAGRFQELTQRRYETVQLTAQLATEGIIVSGAVRQAAQISVGTREQLSALYRLSVAEYLGSAIVLDDQLVQSDDTRMDWFRVLLAEKSRGFQIIVFTCRPGDYLSGDAMVPSGSGIHADTNGGFIRAVDLGRAIRRR